jgi:fluoroquinolone resistance protein
MRGTTATPICCASGSTARSATEATVTDPELDAEYDTGEPSTVDATYSGEDWYGEEMTDRRYLRCVFDDIDLTEASIHGCAFTECTFSRVRFNASRHSDSAYLRCAFTRSNLFEAEFVGCKLVGSAFKECTLRPLRIVGGDWSFVSLIEADLRGIAAQEVRMREIDLTGADCDQAVLLGVDLSGSQLSRASFQRADLRGSDLSAFDLREVPMSEAVITAEQAMMLAQVAGLVIG